MVKEPIILGIDPSLNGCGWCVLEGKNPIKSGVVKIKKTDTREEKIATIVWNIMDVYKEYDPWMVGIEEEKVLKSHTAMIVGRVAGAVEGAILSYGFNYGSPPPIIQVHPQQSRSILGFGNDKKQNLETVRMMFPDIEFIKHDASDAFVIANYTYASYMNLV